MLKKRIIPILLWDGVQCVKPVSFGRPYRKLGTMEQYIQVMERRNIDELIIIDIEATPNKRKPNYVKLRQFCDNLYCPVTYGGGISTLDDIRDALNNGADKVCIKTAIDLIPRAAEKFGAQCIVLCLDCDGELSSDQKIIVKGAVNFGVGEILLTDIKRDGTMQGYNKPLIYDVASEISIPIIANGGCGEPEHMSKVFDIGGGIVSAVAAGSMFLYTENTPRSCAKYLSEQGHEVRV